MGGEELREHWDTGDRAQGGGSTCGMTVQFFMRLASVCVRDVDLRAVSQSLMDDIRGEGRRQRLEIREVTPVVGL